MMNLKRKHPLVLLSCCALAACSTSTYQQVQQEGGAMQQRAAQLKKQSEQPLPSADLSALPVHRGAYLGATASKQQSGQILPPRVERDGVRFVTGSPQDLLAIGDLIGEATGIPVSFAADVFQANPPGGAPTAAGPSAGNAAELSAALDAAMPRTVRAPAKGRAPALFAGKPSASQREKMRVNYQGPLSGFLNLTASYFDLNWSYRDGRLQFSRFVTRTFQLAAMPSTTDAKSTLNAGLSASSDGSNGGSAGASQTASMTVTLDFWKDLDTKIKTIVGERGSYNVARSDSTVTVTAPASVVERVARQVQQLNRQMLRQVTVKVEVYSVTLNKDSTFQFQPFVQLQRLGVVNWSLGQPVDSGAPGQLLTGTVTGNGHFTGSQLMLNALAEQGQVSTLTDTSVTTMSGQPVPVQVSNTRGYVSQIQTTLSDGTPTTSITTSTVNSGFSINVLPKVMDDGNVLVQYSMNLSSLVGKNNGFDNFAANAADPNDPGGSKDKNLLTVQLPNIDQRSFIQSGMIGNGRTMVLAGYEQTGNQTQNSGVGSPDFKALGGERTGKRAHEILVILITPQVLDHSRQAVNFN
ncbi:secretin N-terminal domain-containing protein [Paludibacterium sp.]|uniref:secretin N-terminal domain-containing protein n=1 Tax=Paludibacterium sp. TaxID=1917523 RepID=UPI0025E20C5A|nr:secretin N-terminal domain-containing protein [Paludibacterium sp.]MBV8645841.1 secretin N-terminal domain-containing protein [Paludibacterium sp.]